MTGELDLVRRLRPPVSDSDPALVDRARKELMAVINQESDRQTAPSQMRPRRRWIVPILIAAALATGAATWAIFADISTSTKLACHVPADGIAIVDAVSGDPVADCTALWQRDYGTDPPPLVAYDNGHGGIEVVAVGTAVPSDWTKLEPAQGVALIELEEALDDVATGLASSCHTAGDATAIVNRELERLHLTSWTVTTDSRSVGESTCSYFHLDPEQQQVVLVALGIGAPPRPAVMLATRLNDALDEECMTLDDAAVTATAIATDIGIQDTLELHSVPDEEASCTRAHTNVGGTIRVILRGPTG